MAVFPPELQEKVFELYFTTKERGTGIGLAQTYQILQWHYGSVDFESIQGQGTTFPFAHSISGVALGELAGRGDKSMIARLPRTKIAKAVWLSSLLAPFFLSALAQTISAQTTDLQTKATRPAQISPASSANKDTVPGQKTVKRPPSTRMKSQVSKAPLKVHPTAVEHKRACGSRRQ